MTERLLAFSIQRLRCSCSDGPKAVFIFDPQPSIGLRSGKYGGR
jgi:hypothetical protein